MRFYVGKMVLRGRLDALRARDISSLILQRQDD